MSLPLSPASSTPHLVSEVALRDEIEDLAEQIKRLQRRRKKRAVTDSGNLTGGRSIESGRRQSGGRDTDPIEASNRARQGQEMQLRLPSYDGGADWAAYEAQLEIVASYAGWSDSDTAANLCLALQGEALRVLVDLPTESRYDLQALKGALKARFDRQPCEATAKLEMASRRRGRGERLGVLASELALLTRRAYPAFTRTAQRQLALDQFLRALEPAELRRHVRLANPCTLEAVIEEAERAEPILAGQLETWRAPPRVVDRRPMDGGRVRDRMACRNCGGHGHRSRECTVSGNGIGASQ